jgi:hypothetical protein
MRTFTFFMLLTLTLAGRAAWAEAPASAQSATEAKPPTEEKPAELRLFKNRKHPVVENPVFALGELLGGWSGQGWTTIDYAKLAVPKGEDPSEAVRVTGLIKKGTKVRFFSNGKQIGKGRAGELIHSTEQMYGDHTLAWPDQMPRGSVGIAGDWNPYPRRATRGDKQLVKDAVAELLTKSGVKKVGNPVITQVKQIDVDNDGVDDFFVVAKKKKAYLLAALITPEPKRSISLHFSDYQDDDDALGTVEIFDANGDGKMEILLESFGLESHSVVLYEVRGDQAVSAFSEK